jgi:hypothetical protein
VQSSAHAQGADLTNKLKSEVKNAADAVKSKIN